MRLSGPETFKLADKVFTPSEHTLAEMEGFRASDGLLRIASAGIELPARAYVFRGPRSFTGEDVIELHIPGSSAAATLLVDQLCIAGARLAGPGEFTARAFLGGKMDLSAAEAVADVIDAANDSQLRAAISVLDGQVERLCRCATEELTDILASVEASIDVAPEEIALDSPSQLSGRLEKLSGNLAKASETASAMPESSELPMVVLAGRTNAGKSSLLNALSGLDRAIVSALAGTTRDVLSATMTLPNCANTLLLDAAGFAPADTPLEAASHLAARNAISRADLIAFVADSSEGEEATPKDLGLLHEIRLVNNHAPILLLASKCDLPKSRGAALADLSEITGNKPIETSSITQMGLGKVRRAIAETLHATADRSGGSMGLHLRQKRCLSDAASASARAAEVLAGAGEVADVAELIAVDLRAAAGSIGQVSGQIVTEDILGRIFQRFCVGK